MKHFSYFYAKQKEKKELQKKKQERLEYL